MSSNISRGVIYIIFNYELQLVQLTGITPEKWRYDSRGRQGHRIKKTPVCKTRVCDIEGEPISVHTHGELVHSNNCSTWIVLDKGWDWDKKNYHSDFTDIDEWIDIFRHLMVEMFETVSYNEGCVRIEKDDNYEYIVSDECHIHHTKYFHIDNADDDIPWIAYCMKRMHDRNVKEEAEREKNKSMHASIPKAWTEMDNRKKRRYWMKHETQSMKLCREHFYKERAMEREMDRVTEIAIQRKKILKERAEEMYRVEIAILREKILKERAEEMDRVTEMESENLNQASVSMEVRTSTKIQMSII